MIRVLEVDQWTATGIKAMDETKLTMDEIAENVSLVTGGDAEAAQAIFGGHAKIREVAEDDHPSIGNVWYREQDGRLEIWKARYDSS